MGADSEPRDDVSSHGLDASRPADPTIDVELVDAVFDEWVARRAADPSAGYLVLYELASRRVGQPVMELDPALRRALGDRALPVIYPGSSFVPGSSTGRQPIVVVDYDPTWPQKYEVWRGRIVAVVPADARVEHVGSTSVPGLPAKPIIDIQLSVSDVND